MATRPSTAICDGVDLSQHIRDGAAMAATTLPGGKKSIEFVVRYTSPNTPNNPQKLCTDADIKTCRDNNLALVLVHEEGAEAARGSYAAGQADAAQALAFVRSKGMPPDTVVHWAIDFDAAGPEIVEYSRGFGDKMGRGRRAVYGGRGPLGYLFDHGLIDYGWQTYAWSTVNGIVVWDKRITAAQWRNTQLVAGNTVDYDSACALDYGQLGPGWTSTDRDVMAGVPVDLTPAAVEAVRAAVWGTMVGSANVSPPTDKNKVRADQAMRDGFYRLDYVANTLPGDIQEWVNAVLAQSRSNGGGITELKVMVSAITGGASAAGITPAQIADVLQAGADKARTMVPPTTPAPTP